MQTQGRVAGNASAKTTLPEAHSRGYLPHIEEAEFQMITYRLGDALPAEVMQRLAHLNSEKKRIATEQLLDAGYGQCWLAYPGIAKIVIDNWLYFAGKRYRILAYVVMPNHVHLLIHVFEDSSLSKIIQSWKSYTAKKIAKQLGLAGQQPTLPIWQPDYWDRFIRNQAHFEAAIAYIHNNPASAGLVACSTDWRWSSDYKSRS